VSDNEQTGAAANSGRGDTEAGGAGGETVATGAGGHAGGASGADRTGTYPAEGLDLGGGTSDGDGASDASEATGS